MSRTWSFYDPATGEFTGRTYSGSPAGLELNTPDGCSAFEGSVDHETMRVNPETDALEQWRDPPPSADHVWDAAGQAWRLSRTAQQRDVLARIGELEAQQLRPLRELALDPASAQARSRVQAIETEISLLRALLTRPD
ncbi:MAG TPA: hypothetical protein PLX85_00240 [Dehalococcoidia bacterium]|nr:hypothetical protein [Dehalococcoidia bacterium]